MITSEEFWGISVKNIDYDRSVILSTAQQLVSSDREKEHGDARKNFEKVLELQPKNFKVIRKIG